MAHLTNFSFEFFYKIFTEDASLPLLYHGAKKSKMTKNSNQGGGGPALNELSWSLHILFSFVCFFAAVAYLYDGCSWLRNLPQIPRWNMSANHPRVLRRDKKEIKKGRLKKRESKIKVLFTLLAMLGAVMITKAQNNPRLRPSRTQTKKIKNPSRQMQCQ